MSAHDTVLAVHVAAGSAGLVLGPLALRADRPPSYQSGAGTAYHWAVLAVALTAIALVAFDVSGLWWLTALAALAYGLALLGHRAPRRRHRAWIRAYAHGQGGSYVALVTALLVVSLNGPAMIAAWLLPTLIGTWLIERRVARITREERRSEIDLGASAPRDRSR